jgi:hypothetical protein
MIKVGFIINFNSKKWLGGFNLIINLIKSLRILKKKQIEPILIIDENVPLNELKRFNIKIIKTNYFSKEKTYQRIFNKILIHLFGKSYLYDRFFKILKIDILSHTLLSLGKKSSIKSFPWIPDFQYYHYPENFSLKNRIMKKLNIVYLGKHSNKIILSSKSARNDLKKISYNAYKNSVSNPFSFDLLKKNQIINSSKIKKKYKLKNNFFYLPNQYFVHKNHMVVLKALKKLLNNKKNKDITIVSTGFNNDHRNPNYFKEIMLYIKKNKLNNNFIYLGVVPYKDMMSLIYNSVALINPSKFEGWSSSVEQAKSMGKKILLSDISVHKEQNPKRAEFFSQNNYDELAYKIKKIWFGYNYKYEKILINRSYRALEKKLSKYASDYQEIILNN